MGQRMIAMAKNDHGIGRVEIKKGTPVSLIRRIEIALIGAKLFIAWDGKGFVVNDLAAARDFLGRGIEIDLDHGAKKERRDKGRDRQV